MQVVVGASVISGAPLLPAMALSYTVNNTVPCSDSGGAPFCTIGAAAQRATAGDTVTVLAGTYAENVRPSNSGAEGAPIIFEAPQDSGVTVRGQSNGFKLSGRSYIKVQGFTISNTTSYGFELLTSSNITLSRNRVLDAGNNGIYVRESDNVTISENEVDEAISHSIYVKLCTVNLTVSRNLVTRSGAPVASFNKMGIYLSGSTGVSVEENTVEENTNAGIYLVDGTNGVLVKGNNANNNAWQFQRGAPGIEVRGTGTTANIIDGNISYHNEDSGIQMYSGTTDNLIVNNLTYNNGDHGIDNYNAPNMQIIGNTVYGNVTSGINVEGNSSTASQNAKIANNISVDNGINSPRTKGNIRIDSASLPGSTADYDFVWLSVPSTMFQFGSAFPKTLAEWQATNPALEANASGDLDPQWQLQPARDFHTPLPIPDIAADFDLRSASPAIDAANSAVTNDLGYNLGHDLQGLPRNGAYDAGAYEF